MTPEDVRWQHENGLLTASGYIYLTIKASDGERLQADSAQDFCQKLGLPKATFYRAIAKLKQLGCLQSEFKRYSYLVDLSEEEGEES